MSRDSASQPATARGFTPRHAVAPTELFCLCSSSRGFAALHPGLAAGRSYGPHPLPLMAIFIRGNLRGKLSFMDKKRLRY
jgi:hypothetical protein